MESGDVDTQIYKVFDASRFFYFQVSTNKFFKIRKLKLIEKLLVKIN